MYINFAINRASFKRRFQTLKLASKVLAAAELYRSDNSGQSRLELRGQISLDTKVSGPVSHVSWHLSIATQTKVGGVRSARARNVLNGGPITRMPHRGGFRTDRLPTYPLCRGQVVVGGRYGKFQLTSVVVCGNIVTLYMLLLGGNFVFIV